MSVAGQPLGRGLSIALVLGATALFAALLVVLGCPAPAAAVAPAWSIDAVSEPTNVSPTAGGHVVLLVSDDGGARTTSEPVSVTDTVSSNLRIASVVGHLAPSEEEGPEVICTATATTATCSFESSLTAENTQGLSIVIGVEPVEATTATATSTTVVTGGGAARTTSTQTLPITAADPPFGLSDFRFALLDAAGGVDTQAGDHPNAVTVNVDFNTVTGARGSEQILSVQPPKSLSLELPVGLIGNPRSSPTCRQYELTNPPLCPPDTVIGAVAYRGESPETLLSEPVKSSGRPQVTLLYNVQPEQGYPAEFAFEYLGHTDEIYTSVIHRGSQYAMRMSVPAINPVSTPSGLQLTFFGDPAAVDGTASPSTALFTAPSHCAAEGADAAEEEVLAKELTAQVSTTSWSAPFGAAPPAPLSVTLGQPTGCAKLQFAPRLQVQPQTLQADSPTGVTVHLAMAQNESATGLSTPPLRDATVTFPAGMSLSLPAGNGLRGCANTGTEGIDLYEEEIGADGESHAIPGHCQRASQIGGATIVTPLLSAPLEGGVYLAQPACEPCDEQQVEEGMLVKVFVEAKGAGIDLKLPGVVEVGGAGAHTGTGEPALARGQLRLQLRQDPQLPISEVQLTLNGGPLALMANPAGCERATSTSEIVPWGAQALAATPESFFTTGWSEAGEACPAVRPFAPSFQAGTASALAGAASPFTMTFARHDREQLLSRITMRTPPGFAALMAGVGRCGEPQASLGTCPAASAVGHVNAALGPGSQPLWVQGTVYLTEPYGGAPFGLSLTIPAKAGPFDLGDVVVRAAIAVDPHTEALTIATSPLPSSAAGVPLRVQTLSMTLDRPGFSVNPTDCAQQQQVSATIASAQGATAALSTPFAVGACADLPFKAQITAHSEARTSRNAGAYLHLMVRSDTGQANVAKIHVVLPKQLPTRLSALQHACPARIFDADPAGCPAASVVGNGIVHTQALSSPLVGPAYFVSHGGAAFPDLDLVLQGEGVLVDLDGHTTITNNITTASFDSVPDMRLRSLGLVLPEGPDSMLAADGSLCAKPLSLASTLVGQNGAQETQSTHLAVGGCPRGASARAARSHIAGADGRSRGGKRRRPSRVASAQQTPARR